MPDLELLRIDTALLKGIIEKSYEKKTPDIDAENDPSLNDLAVMMLIFADRYHHVFSNIRAIKDLYEDNDI